MIVGVLLAAGAGTRFGGDKLLAHLSGGLSVAEMACATLCSSVDRVIAVVPEGAATLRAQLERSGAYVAECPHSRRGMGASLAYGVAETAGADGWLVALADMPLLLPSDIARVAVALRGQAPIAVAESNGRFGHPVGFSHRFRDDLLALHGDVGARRILAQHDQSVVRIPVADSTSWLDIDTPADLIVARARLTDASMPCASASADALEQASRQVTT